MSGNIPAGAHNERSAEGKFTKGFEDEDVYGPRNLNAWADIKEYDDDEDRQWFQAQNAELGKYGVEINTDILIIYASLTWRWLIQKYCAGDTEVFCLV